MRASNNATSMMKLIWQQQTAALVYMPEYSVTYEGKT